MNRCHKMAMFGNIMMNCGVQPGDNVPPVRLISRLNDAAVGRDGAGWRKYAGWKKEMTPPMCGGDGDSRNY